MVSVFDLFANLNETDHMSIDFDKDNKTNVDEFQNKTDPCSTDSSSQNAFTESDINLPNNNSIASLGNHLATADYGKVINDSNNKTTPFTFVLKKTGGIAGIASQLQYHSVTKTLISTTNGNMSTKQVSLADEMLLKQTLNNSGFFESISFYPPSEGADYFEYTLIATLNNKLNAVYWTDVSNGVPPGVQNLPFILSYILDKEGEGF